MKRSVRLLNSAVERSFNDVVSLVAYVPKFLTPAECDRVAEIAEQIPARDAGTGAGPDIKYDEARDSRVRFCFPTGDTQWLFDKLEHSLLSLNRGYKFDLRGFYEGFQVASYEPGGHYDWHMDVGKASSSARKLSMSVQLSDPADYDGGELEFKATDELGPRDQGYLIVFPSFLLHRVRPVTRGKRMSMVSWISGPPFK